jgi:hypothetical protein
LAAPQRYPHLLALTRESDTSARFLSGPPDSGPTPRLRKRPPPVPPGHQIFFLVIWKGPGVISRDEGGAGWFRSRCAILRASWIAWWASSRWASTGEPSDGPAAETVDSPISPRGREPPTRSRSRRPRLRPRAGLHARPPAIPTKHESCWGQQNRVRFRDKKVGLDALECLGFLTVGPSGSSRRLRLSRSPSTHRPWRGCSRADRRGLRLPWRGRSPPCPRRFTSSSTA